MGAIAPGAMDAMLPAPVQGVMDGARHCIGDGCSTSTKSTILPTLNSSFEPDCSDEMPPYYSNIGREKQFDEEGNLLEEKPLDANEVRRRKKIAAVTNKVEDLIQRAKNSDDGIDFLATSLMNIVASFGQIVPTTVQATQEEYESFIGCRIPDQVEIHPPTDVRSKGRSKRIKRAKEVPKSRKGKNAATVIKEPPQ